MLSQHSVHGVDIHSPVKELRWVIFYLTLKVSVIRTAHVSHEKCHEG